MITLDGQPLLVDVTGELEEFIKAFIPTDQYLPWLRRSWPGFGNVGLTYPIGMRFEPKFKLGQFRWPTGASRWAYGHFLTDVNQGCNLQQLINDAFGSTNQSIGHGGAWNAVPFVLDTQGTQPPGEKISTNVFVMPPVPLTGIRGSPQVNSLYLLTIVDERFFWWYTYVGNLQIDSSTTWQTLYNVVSGAIGIKNFTFDSIDPAYLQPSTMFNLPFETAPQILDAIAFNVGHRIVRNYDGTVKSQNYNTALTMLNNDFANNQNRTLLAGGQRFNQQL